MPICTIDIFPTLLEIARVPLPKDRPIDGVSLVPVLKDDPQRRQGRETVGEPRRVARRAERRAAELRGFLDQMDRATGRIRARLAEIQGETPEEQAERKAALGAIDSNEKTKKHLERELRVWTTLLENAQAQLDRDALYWHFPHYRGQLGPYSIVRSSRWKLLRFYDSDTRELYNLKRDLGEKNDLAAKMPEKVKELDAKLDAWLKSVGAKMPKPNPDYEPPKAKPARQPKRKTQTGRSPAVGGRPVAA